MYKKDKLLKKQNETFTNMFSKKENDNPEKNNNQKFELYQVKWLRIPLTYYEHLSCKRMAKKEGISLEKLTLKMITEYKNNHHKFIDDLIEH